MRKPFIFIALFLAGASPAIAEEAVYIGVEQCMVCHLPHYDSWKQTRMANAFELLKPGVRKEAKRKAGMDPSADYTKDPLCLQCHTTGYGKPGGFISEEETPELKGVQCEMCHGPGSIYAVMMLKKRGTYKREDYVAKGSLIFPSEQRNVCTATCHNERSPFVTSLEFNFEDRKAIGTHRHDLRYIDLPFDL